jgi:hypothetical protein
MKRTSIAAALVVLSSTCLAATTEPLCVLSPADMPESWRPQGEVQKTLSTAPWSASETEDAGKAIRKGLDEMVDYYAQHPDAVTSVWEDTVASVYEVTYSGSNRPDIQAFGRDAGRRYLEMLIEPFVKRDADSATCKEYEQTLPLAIYSHKLLEPGDQRTGAMIAFANAAYEDCGSLEDAMEYDYPEMLSTNDTPIDDIFDLVIWSLLFIEIEVIPGLEMPEGAHDFPPALWHYLEQFPLQGAEDYEEGAWDDEFIEMAYLATHIAYIPTGNHRYPIYIEDSPSLYRYHRENFYPVLEMGELDLVAEFVDSLRQYGCTEENDLQVRDGTRYLLRLFHSLGDSWMAYRERGQTDAEVDDYDLIHKAWTGILGVRSRVIEPSDPGTYGGVVRSWLPHPR